MLISKEVEVSLNPMNIKYYEEKGYDIPKIKNKWGKFQTPRGTTIKVKVDDLQEGSHVEVEVLCDYCLETIKKPWKIYLRDNQNGIIHKDACDDCRIIKMKESNMQVYGEEQIFSIPEIREKIVKTNLKKYGYDNVAKNPEITIKQQNTLYNRYGTTNLYSIPRIREKAIKTNLLKYGSEWQMQNSEILNKAKITLFEKQNYMCSNQQRYICRLLNGELNYPVSNCSLDIAFPGDKIYVEYNGGGHNLQVVFGNVSEKEFINKEIKRYYYLRSLGWKGIFINSYKDYLPSDEILLNEFNKALEWFLSNEKGHWHYNINIGNKINDMNFGRLRKITNDDLNKKVS